MNILFIIISSLMGSFIAAPIVLASGRRIGKVEKITFWNTYLVCVLGTLFVYLFCYLLGNTHFFIKAMRELSGIIFLLCLYFLVAFISFTIIGKMMWKCGWINAIKTNIIWLLINLATISTILIMLKEQIQNYL